MARLRFNNVGDAAGATNPVTLTGGGTTLTFTSAPSGLPTIAAPDYMVITVEPGTANEEIVQITAYTAAATTATVVRNFEATTGGQNSSAAHTSKGWVHGPTVADYGTLPTARASYAGGNVSLTSASWAVVNSGLDLVVAAKAGDVVLLAAAFQIDSGAADLNFDFATLVSGTLTTFCSGAGSGGNGIPGLAKPSGNTAFPGLTGAVQYVVQAGDVVSGNVTFRLVYRNNNGNGSTHMFAGATDFPIASVVNLTGAPIAGSPVGDAVWTNVTLASGSNSGVPSAPVSYRKDANGFVHIRGRVTGSSGTIFTLPAGYRPAFQYNAAIVNGGTGAYAFCTLSAAGVMTANAADVVFDSCSPFLAEN